jgi:transcriptional regulator with PAS, ATPase and Fis domain
VRIIAASNRDVEQEVRAGKFREDLYYRLNVFPIRVPPLRERRSDIPLLARFFLERYSHEFAKPVAGLTDGALQCLINYAWPGNVRELQNEVQRLVIQADQGEPIDASLVSAKMRQPITVESTDDVPVGPLKDMLDAVERKFIQDALARHGNNKTSTAKALGITREGLHKKLRQLKL